MTELIAKEASSKLEELISKINILEGQKLNLEFEKDRISKESGRFKEALREIKSVMQSGQDAKLLGGDMLGSTGNSQPLLVVGASVDYTNLRTRPLQRSGTMA